MAMEEGVRVNKLSLEGRYSNRSNALSLTPRNDR